MRFKSYSFIPSSAGSPLFPTVLPGVPTESGARPDVVFASGDFANPAIYQTEFAVEHELFTNFTVSAIYMGNRGTRMPVFRDTNLFASSQTATYTVCGSPQVGSSTACSNPTTTFAVPFFSGARPNTSYGYMTIADSVVNTWYNALAIQAKQRFSRGFQLQAGFTWSKALDDDQNSITFTSSNVPMNPFNLNSDYSLSDFDQRRRFTMSGVWQLPGHRLESQALRRVVNGFQLSGIFTLADGRPYSGTVSGNPSPSGIQGGLLGLAEDNPVNRTLAVRLLEREGYRPIVACDGREALAAFEVNYFDLALVDIQMPEVDGFEVTAAIRRHEAQHGGHLPIIAMTAHAMKGDAEHCIAAGMDGYVSKPIVSGRLFEEIESVLAAAHARVSS